MAALVQASFKHIVYMHSLFGWFVPNPIQFIHCAKKNCAFLFVSELRQISTNFNKFW